MNRLVTAPTPAPTRPQPVVEIEATPPEGVLLLVEPDPAIRGRLQRRLAASGYEVTAVGSAEAACSALAGGRFTHALVEIRLPDSCGVALIGRLRTRDRGLRIVVLTQHPSFASVVVAVRAGAADYLAKPAGPDEILEALAGTAPEPEVPDMPLAADRVEWEYVHRLFQQCGRNVTQTALRLGMHRRSLQRMLAKRAPAPRRSCLT